MSYPGTSHYDTVTCRVCGGPLDPDLGYDGMHPECEAENYRRNLR